MIEIYFLMARFAIVSEKDFSTIITFISYVWIVTFPIGHMIMKGIDCMIAFFIYCMIKVIGYVVTFLICHSCVSWMIW